MEVLFAVSSLAMAVSALLYLGSLALVIWAVVDIVRQPAVRLSAGRKLGWALGAVVGWLVMGLVGAAVAAVYLVAVRPRLGRPPRFGGGWPAG